MRGPGRKRPEALANGSLRPGTLSALLQELVRAPELAQGGAPRQSLAPGALVGRYELIRELGRGGFGVVWEARDRELHRTVAFKAVRPGGRPDLREERLLREAEAAARLSHPNIVAVLDAGRAEQGPYLVLELLQGETLARRLDQGSIPVREALRLGVEIAKGLAHAHEQGVVHRDLTPGNVFLCRDGQVKVLDLGMAHAFGRPKAEGGTRAYMAPEQAAGAPEDERTDVFALGVVLHRMLSGRLPYPAGDGVLARYGGAAPALEIPDLPGLGALVGRMLRWDPVSRPRNAGEVLGALSALQQELAGTPASASVVRVRRIHRPRAAALAAAGLLACAGIAGLVAWLRGPPATSGPAPSVAVMPFTDLSPGHDQEYFADGVAQQILSSLASVEGLRVPGRASSFHFRGKDLSPAEIAGKLGVASLLTGSVRRSGDSLRIEAELVRADTGERLWSRTFDRAGADVFVVQDEIARAVVEALKVKLLAGGPYTGPRPTPTTSPEAYNQYLLGQRLYRAGPASHAAAVATFEKALALDPGFASAWAALAIPLVSTAISPNPPPADAQQRIRKALAAAERALELSPELCDGLSARGAVRQHLREWAGAEDDIARAVRLCPGDPDAWRRYAGLLDALGRAEEAVVAIERAIELDPLGYSVAGAAYIQLNAGRLEESRRMLERLGELSPGRIEEVCSGLADLLLLQGRAAEALAKARSCERVPHQTADIVAKALHSLGRASEASAAIEELAALRRGRPFDQEIPDGVWIAAGFAWMGRSDEAFEWLDRALAERPVVSLHLIRNPYLRSLHGDPRWSSFLRRNGLPADSPGRAAGWGKPAMGAGEEAGPAPP